MNKKKLNSNFVDLYSELDKACCEKFGISVGGVTEYINRLNNARFAPDRDEVLPKLVNYRNVRNAFVEDANELRKNGELSKEDLKWVKSFQKDLKKKNDPISVYLKKAKKYASRRKFGKFLLTVVILAAVAAAAYVVAGPVLHLI